MELPTICTYGQLFRYLDFFQNDTSANKLVQVLSNLSNCHHNLTNVSGVESAIKSLQAQSNLYTITTNP